MGSILSANLLKKRNQPPRDEGGFVWQTGYLLASDAWRTAPINTRRFVERVEVEWMAHAGKENGRLIITYDDCVAWGISRRFVYQAMKDAIRRGLVYRTQRGGLAAGSEKWPSRYGLGWLPAHDGAPAPNRWKAWHPPRTAPKPKRLPYRLEIYRGVYKGALGNGHAKPPFPES